MTIEQSQESEINNNTNELQEEINDAYKYLNMANMPNTDLSHRIMCMAMARDELQHAEYWYSYYIEHDISMSNELQELYANLESQSNSFRI